MLLFLNFRPFYAVASWFFASGDLLCEEEARIRSPVLEEALGMNGTPPVTPSKIPFIFDHRLPDGILPLPKQFAVVSVLPSEVSPAPTKEDENRFFFCLKNSRSPLNLPESRKIPVRFLFGRQSARSMITSFTNKELGAYCRNVLSDRWVSYSRRSKKRRNDTCQLGGGALQQGAAPQQDRFDSNNDLIGMGSNDDLMEHLDGTTDSEDIVAIPIEPPLRQEVTEEVCARTFTHRSLFTYCCPARQAEVVDAYGSVLAATCLTSLLSEGACFLWREFKESADGQTLRTSITMQDISLTPFDGTILVSLPRSQLIHATICFACLQPIPNLSTTLPQVNRFVTPRLRMVNSKISTYCACNLRAKLQHSSPCFPDSFDESSQDPIRCPHEILLLMATREICKGNGRTRFPEYTKLMSKLTVFTQFRAL